MVAFVSPCYFDVWYVQVCVSSYGLALIPLSPPRALFFEYVFMCFPIFLFAVHTAPPPPPHSPPRASSPSAPVIDEGTYQFSILLSLFIATQRAIDVAAMAFDRTTCQFRHPHMMHCCRSWRGAGGGKQLLQ